MSVCVCLIHREAVLLAGSRLGGLGPDGSVPEMPGEIRRWGELR